MYSVITFMAWAMFGLCSLFFLAELIDMLAAARRRLADGPAEPPTGSFGSFNLEPRESNLSRRHDHKLSTRGGSWGGLNRFD